MSKSVSIDNYIGEVARRTTDRREASLPPYFILTRSIPLFMQKESLMESFFFNLFHASTPRIIIIVSVDLFESFNCFARG